MTIEERLDIVNPRQKDHLGEKCPNCITGHFKLKHSPRIGLAIDMLICPTCKFEVERLGTK